MIPPLLERDAEELTEVTGLAVELLEHGSHIDVVISEVALPDGIFATDTTDVLFIAQAQYRDAAIDMFFTHVDVVRPDGATPRNADVVEEHAGRRWRRFSYHRKATWNRNGNGLLDHLAVVEQRFAMEAA